MRPLGPLTSSVSSWALPFQIGRHSPVPSNSIHFVEPVSGFSSRFRWYFHLPRRKSKSCWPSRSGFIGGGVGAGVRASPRLPRIVNAARTSALIGRTRNCLMSTSSLSVLAVPSLYGFEQLLRVVPDAVLEDDLHVFDVGDPHGRI